MDKTQSRIGDMGEGNKLQLHIEEDGDIIVCIMPYKHKLPNDDAELQFCISGGKSPKTLKALHQLYQAMKEDNESDLSRERIYESWHNTKNELLKGILPSGKDTEIN